MKKPVNAFCNLFRNLRNLCKAWNRCRFDFINGFKTAHKRFSSGCPDSRYIIQNGFHLALTAQRTMIFNRKTMGLILNAGDQFKSFRTAVNGNLFIVEIQPPGSMVIILHHSAHRNRKPKFFQYFQGNIYLSFSTIHQKQIREFRK